MSARRFDVLRGTMFPRTCRLVPLVAATALGFGFLTDVSVLLDGISIVRLLLLTGTVQQVANQICMPNPLPAKLS
jgi:hypothetical protein